MEDHQNPFASPLAEEQPRHFAPGMQSHNALWTEDGVLLKAVDGAEFPDRCVKCNAPAKGYRLKKTYSWHPGWVYFLLLLNILIYIIGALTTRKQATFAVGLCQEHRSKRMKFMAAAWALALLGIGITVGGFVWDDFVGLIFLGFVVLVAGLITGIVGARVFSPKIIEPRLATLRGAGPEFLLSLQP